MKNDIYFDAFWDRCMDRVDYVKAHVDGEANIVTYAIAIAYEAAVLVSKALEEDHK